MSPERLTEEEVRTDKMKNRLKVLDNPLLVKPEIPLSDEDLDEFMKTFALTKVGKQIEKWVKTGANCEAMTAEKDPSKRCGKPAAGSVDWYGTTNEDSILVCRKDIRFVYGSVMTDDVLRNGLLPVLTINGKEIPRPDSGS